MPALLRASASELHSEGRRPTLPRGLSVPWRAGGWGGVGGSPHCPSVLLANLLKGTCTEKMRPVNMTCTPSSGRVTYILMPTWEVTMPSFWKPGLTTLLLKMI